MWPLLTLHVGALGVFALGVHRGVGTPFLFLVALLAGTGTPPVGTVTRLMWRRLTHGETRTTVLALDAVLTDVGFLVGPLLAIALSEFVAPGTGLIVCCLLLTVALPLVVRGDVPRVPRPRGRHGPVSAPLRSPTLRRLFSTAFCFFFGVNLMETVLATYGAEGHASLAGGTLLGVISLASIMGGIVVGGVPARLAGRLMHPSVALTGIATGLLLHAAAHLAGPVPVFVTALPVGCFLGVCFASIYGAAGDHAPEGAAAETQSWVSTVMTIGGGLGTAAGGWCVQHQGPVTALLIAAVVWGVGALTGARLPRLTQGNLPSTTVAAEADEQQWPGTDRPLKKGE